MVNNLFFHFVKLKDVKLNALNESDGCRCFGNLLAVVQV